MKKKSQLKWCVNRHNIKIYYYNNKSLDLQILKVHWRATSYDGSNLFYRTQQMHPCALKFYPFEKSIIFDSSRLIMFCQQLTWASMWLITNILLKCRCQLLIGKKTQPIINCNTTSALDQSKQPPWKEARLLIVKELKFIINRNGDDANGTWGDLGSSWRWGSTI